MSCNHLDHATFKRIKGERGEADKAVCSKCGRFIGYYEKGQAGGKSNDTRRAG